MREGSLANTIMAGADDKEEKGFKKGTATVLQTFLFLIVPLILEIIELAITTSS